jgi:hypothetical protein
MYNKYLKLINQYFKIQQQIDTTLQSQQDEIVLLTSQLKQCRQDPDNKENYLLMIEKKKQL